MIDYAAEYYKFELVATTFHVSYYEIFVASYKAEGYIVTEEWVESHYGEYISRQSVPIQVLQFCDKVLSGRYPFPFKNGGAALIA